MWGLEEVKLQYVGLFALVSALLLPMTSAHAADPIAGRWITEDGKAVVTIASCGNTICGKITRILAPTPDGPPVDENNPDRRLRNRPIMGLPVLTGFTESGDEWRGRIYSPEEGKTYRSIMKRAGANRLAVKGCIAIFCKTQSWKRAN